MQQASNPIIECSGLSIGYADMLGKVARVVDEVSFRLGPGQSMGIVGESGSGKSTLARALLGYLRGGGRFDGGRLLVDGIEITSTTFTSIRSLRGLRVAMVPQNPLASLTYHMPVGRQVEEVLRSRRGLVRVEAERRVVELFAEMGLPHPETIGRRYPHQLSGGQRQRVVIAAALACDPALLVLDEPTTALDKTTEAQVLELIQHMRVARGAALVLVTHDLNVVADVCERVLVMKEGRIVEQGLVSAVFRQPEDTYTQTLLGASLDLSGAAPSVNAGLKPLVSVQDLTFRYQQSGWFGPKNSTGKPTLDGVNLSLGRGEVLGVIGESGSGKTTLGLVLAGLIAAEKGVLMLEEQSIAMLAGKRQPALRRRIQTVFQDPLSSLNPRQTVATAIMRPLRHFFGMNSKSAREKAASLLADLGLGPEFLERYPRQLSGGQQQRVAIARAFAAEPDVLICDEITSALDASVAGQVLGELDALRQKHGTSVILITHDLAVIWRMASRVMVLKDGLVIETGATADVFAAPKDAYTANLLSSASRVRRLGQDTTLIEEPLAHAV
ncbi:ABC transporter ATP-binding protein [Rhabdaerophilum sp. SD176]|uniref:nickel ABC transporter ATP-binding protein NikE n=1 Tax=Rhabdaerophilum sp. SD176 TaxID=2983548 RepID=UPI0024DFFA61|nr:ABC transporter ATP-binding protein [Rhabdaerophilum sp. SD176]